MTLKKAGSKYSEFHLREPREIVPLHTKIPRYVYPIGYGVQVSYRSDKWNDDERWIDYIHWWENPTLVCVSNQMLPEVDFGFTNPKRFDLGQRRGEVTFLGQAIDFNVAEEDRSDIVLPRVEHTEESFEIELEKIRDSIAFPFCPKPGRSKDFVVCSPNGRIVYVISEDQKQVFAFIGNKVRVTTHGIEG